MNKVTILEHLLDLFNRVTVSTHALLTTCTTAHRMSGPPALKTHRAAYGDWELEIKCPHTVAIPDGALRQILRDIRDAAIDLDGAHSQSSGDESDELSPRN